MTENGQRQQPLAVPAAPVELVGRGLDAVADGSTSTSCSGQHNHSRLTHSNCWSIPFFDGSTCMPCACEITHSTFSLDLCYGIWGHTASPAGRGTPGGIEPEAARLYASAAACTCAAVSCPS